MKNEISYDCRMEHDMKTKSNCIFMAFLLGVLITGCSQEPIITPTQISTLVPSMLTNTPTFTAEPKDTDTQTPTPEIQNFEGRLAIAGLSRQHSEVRLFNLRNGEIQDIPGLGFGSVSWSPDYQRIAFVGGVTQSSHSTAIYVSKPDGSDLKKYGESNLRKANLSWAPDGKFLVFSYDNRIESANLAILNLTSGEMYLITNTPRYESHPAWSPDGKKIAYLYPRQGGLSQELWIMNADGSNPKPVTDFPIASTGIDWSPDGNWLAIISDGINHFHNCGDVYIIRPDGSELTRLTDLSGCATDVTWSPDGKHLALVIRDIPDEMQCQIYIMDTTGKNLVAVGEKEELRIEDIDWGL